MTRAQIRTLDQFVREELKKRYPVCQKCGSSRFLQVSHIYSRRYVSLRHHPLNVLRFCAACHLAWHHRPTEGVEWAKQFLGTKYLLLKNLSQRIGWKPLVADVKGWWQ